MHLLVRCGATGVDRVCWGIGFIWETIEMRNLILVGALALLVLSPLTASAQQRTTPAPAAPAPVAQTTIEGFPLNKLVAIGVGALVGAAATQAIVGGEVVALIGGVAGGLVGAWWYDNGGSVRVTMREPVGAPVPGPCRAPRIGPVRPEES